MKKKGFTLIELLAVIIILAIIALIAVPQILGVIEKSRKGAAEVSALGYIDAVEKYMIMHDVDPERYPVELKQGQTYKINSGSEVSLLNIFEKVKAEGNEIYLENIIKINGIPPHSGYVRIGEKNKVEYAKLKIKAYEVECEESKCEATKVGDTKGLRITNRKTEFLELEEYNLNIEVSPSNAEVTYESSNQSVATIDSNGKITALTEGEATITVKSGSKKETLGIKVGKESVKITNTNKSYLSLNEEYQLSATTYPTSTISYTSSDESIATVTSTGLVKAVGSGSVTITASANGKTDTITFTTGLESVSISGDSEVIVGSTLQLSATTSPAGGTIAWSSSDNNKATVDSTGLVTGVLAGSVTITATSGDKTDTKTITVKMACSVNVNDVVFSNTYTINAPYTFTVPCDGRYKVELWGASGGNPLGSSGSGTSYPGGLGSYTSGVINLETDDSLYLYIGSTPSLNSIAATYNGGGRSDKDNDTYGGGAGGGASDIRTISELWNNAASLRSRIMVAGGGGGSAYYANAGGGAGGGLTSYSGGMDSRCGSQCPAIAATGGTQISGGTRSGAGYSGNTGWECYGQNGIFGIGGDSSISPSSDCKNTNGYRGGAGGGGWYGGGGGARGYSYSGAGGSSYISGHTGCVGITSTSSSSPKSGCTTGNTNNSCSLTPYINPATNESYQFTNTKMIDGAGHVWTNQDTGTNSNNLMPNPTGGYYSLGVGHSGNGYAKITYLGN